MKLLNDDRKFQNCSLFLLTNPSDCTKASEWMSSNFPTAMKFLKCARKWKGLGCLSSTTCFLLPIALADFWMRLHSMKMESFQSLCWQGSLCGFHPWSSPDSSTVLGTQTPMSTRQSSAKPMVRMIPISL